MNSQTTDAHQWIAIQVWDIPTRVFHWGLVVAMSVSVVSMNTDWLETQWHLRSGIAITALLIFRLCWGYVGAPSARFGQFWPTPSSLLAWWRGSWTGVGHSPCAALSVFAMLTVMIGMVFTGLLANDDISVAGPFASQVSESMSDLASTWHGYLFYVALALVFTHLLAIGFYQWVKHDDLVPAMWHGKRAIAPSLAEQYRAVGAKISTPVWARLLFSLALTSVITIGLYSERVHQWLLPDQTVTAPVARPAW